MMGGYVTLNQLTKDILFEADATHYEYGKAVRFQVLANGSRFVSQEAPKGVYLAVQVEFTGPNGEAMGVFHDLSEDLVATPNCASSIFSKTSGGAFKKKSTFSWTPSYHPWELGVLKTTGNATFKLVWSNGPGGSDKLSSALGIANTYLYMKTVTLTGPSKDSRPDAAAGETVQRSARIDNTACGKAGGGPCSKSCVLQPSDYAAVEGTSHSFKRSPVFVQRVDGGRQTFPAERCLVCRAGAGCRSARVECPTRPGMPVVERLWSTAGRCQGEADKVSQVSDIVCPGPEHWHPDRLDLTRFVPKLRRDFPENFPDNQTAEMALLEYKRMLQLVQLSPGEAVVPSKSVDLAWHAHILDTAAYERDSLRLFGYYLHHAPSFGGAEEKEGLVQMQDAMFKRYEAQFGKAPKTVWARELHDVSEFPSDKVWAAQKSPDCCQARCVKPDCAGCVGCNAIDCGFMGASDEVVHRKKLEQQLSPARFSGYVPSRTAKPLDKDQSPVYLCSVTPHRKTTVSWSIIGDYIHFKHESRTEAWYGIGLANTSTAGMGDGVDYIVSMNTRNYSGVKDMYKWDAGNGWPCWDVEFECSPKNGTKGRKDVEDETLLREKGYTTTTWNRRLITPDKKDWPITDTFVRVLFAFGEEDYFTYHGLNFGECQINFFSGETQGCWWAGPQRRRLTSGTGAEFV